MEGAEPGPSVDHLQDQNITAQDRRYRLAADRGAAEEATTYPLLGSQLKEDSALFQKIVKYNPRVYLALDPDAERKSARLIKNMLTYGVELYKVEIKPYSDVGEMSKDEFMRRKESSKPVSSSFGDFFEYLLEKTIKI